MGQNGDICVEIVDRKIEKHIATMKKMRGETLNHLTIATSDNKRVVCGDEQTMNVLVSILEKDEDYTGRKLELLRAQIKKIEIALDSHIKSRFGK